MVTVATYSKDKKETAIIEDKVRDRIAMCSDDDCECHSFVRYELFKEFLDESDICDVMCFDITEDGGIRRIEGLRNQHKEALIMLIADPTISPVEYMKPSIMAAALMIRPANERSIDMSISMLINAIYSKEETVSEETDEMFTIKEYDGKIRIPFSSILYFEAREKKIFVSTDKKEYSIYTTLESLTKELPERFVRCHKSFIVNKSKIYRVALSKNEIELVGQRYIPVSRSYKPIIKML